MKEKYLQGHSSEKRRNSEETTPFDRQQGKRKNIASHGT
jgi:hypothetical protein